MRSLLEGLNASLSSLRAPVRTFSSTSPVNAASRKKTRPAHLDRYAVAHLERKRLANRARQEELRAQETREAGDPVHGRPTPFVESFDTTLDPSGTTAAAADVDPSGIPRPSRVKHFLQPDEIERALQKAQHLSRPINPAAAAAASSASYAPLDPDAAAAAFSATLDQHRAQHRTAGEAIARITSLAQASRADLRRINIQRCIDAFGRHRTDPVLPRKALAAAPSAAGTAALPAQAGRRPAGPVPRAGPDTGSSEVQIAILTAKIRAVAVALETRGRTDRVTKRDLRLLVHRRQKLLKYLRRKERGGPRWTNVIAKLGLTEATWQGEISL